MAEQEQTQQLFIDPIIRPELDKVQHRVLHRDMDYVAGVDGEEGSGKSVLTMQLCKYLDPNFNLNNIVFTSDQFIALIKDPKTKKGTAIMLDEAYSAANSRATMSEVNRAMIAIATEMRQKNLFIFFVLPSFFDLDRTLAVWRTRALFHVYYGEDYQRGQYVIFPKDTKRELYLAGKKKYSYNFPKSPYPPLRFFGHYVVNEDEYREKKANAFKKRTVSNQAKNWLEQRNAYIKYIYQTLNINQEDIAKIPSQFGAPSIGQRSISFALTGVSPENASD